MVAGGDQYVASLLFHELAHQRQYVKDDSEFSESLRDGRRGARHGTLALRACRARGPRALSRAAAASEQFGELIAAQQTRLPRAIRERRAPEQLRMRKATSLRDAAARVRKAEGDGLVLANAVYDRGSHSRLNNADLGGRRKTFTPWEPALARATRREWASSSSMPMRRRLRSYAAVCAAVSGLRAWADTRAYRRRAVETSASG
jgi:predicted aminopeptidase